jgi:hypothetical protein
LAVDSAQDSYRRAKGGVKLHVLLNHEDYLPEFAVLTDARQHDIKPARQVPLRRGSIVVADRGYNDFALFGRWCSEGVFWVTRMKEGTAYIVEECRDLPQGNRILADQIILLSGSAAETKCPDRLRRLLPITRIRRNLISWSRVGEQHHSRAKRGGRVAEGTTETSRRLASRSL